MYTYSTLYLIWKYVKQWGTGFLNVIIYISEYYLLYVDGEKKIRAINMYKSYYEF